METFDLELVEFDEETAKETYLKWNFISIRFKLRILLWFNFAFSFDFINFSILIFQDLTIRDAIKLRELAI